MLDIGIMLTGYPWGMGRGIYVQSAKRPCQSPPRPLRREEVQTLALQKRFLAWVDLQGRTTISIPAADPDSSGIMAALLNHSGASVQQWFEGPPTFPGVTPSGAFLPDVRDLARLTFTDAGGSLVVVSLPSPNAGIFATDTVTVDPTTITDIITACVGTLVSAAGNPVTAYVAGTRNQISSGK